MSRFFIDRPIFAWVIALVVMLAGGIAMFSLPIAQYPSIAPPSVNISATYPGASAEAVENSVVQIIEQKMNGLDGLDYISSGSDATGSASVSLTFKAGTDPDVAQMQVQNKLQLAAALLPQSVQSQGLQVSKSTANFLMVFGSYTSDPKTSRSDLSDYVITNLQDPLSRVQGVGDVVVFGSQYAMRIWLDPAKLASHNLTPNDVISAINAQNTQVSAGQLGALPSVQGQQINATVTAQSRLQTKEQFRNIILLANRNGATVKLGDVARVDKESENYSLATRFNRKLATGIGIRLATGANALTTASAVNAKIAELSKNLPQGMSIVKAYDSTPFIKVSIEEVVKTLLEAIVLVFLVMYLFLQNWRATLIPTIAIPVVLLGTLGILSVFGYSINTLTMFAMVLAIGLLVDDAIVVVENVERLMHEEHLSPKEATKKSMDQITGALIGIGLVLTAVFVPMAFFSGSVGVIYRQFSITIVAAMGLSVMVALILTPSLCATMLPKVEVVHDKGFLGWFNRTFDRQANRYQSFVGRLLVRSTRALLIYGGLVLVMIFLLMRLPTSFVPDEDQGVLFTIIQLPAGSTQEHTFKVIEKIEDYYLDKEKDVVNTMFSVAGFSFGGSGQNMGMAFVQLKDWSERPGKEKSVSALAGRAMMGLSSIKDAMVIPFAPAAISGLGTSSGFTLQLKDEGGLGHEKLMAARNQMVGLAAKNPILTGVRPGGQDDTPEYRIEIDQAKATAMGISLAEINAVLNVAWAGSYVNDFIDRSRVKKVYVQGDASARMKPEDLNKWFVRNSSGQMVPFSSIATGHWTLAAPKLERFNGVPTIQIQGAAASGYSSGAAMTAIAKIAEQLPEGIGYEWAGLSRQEQQSGSQTGALYALSLIVIFLCLAALYESWSIPFSIMLVVPLGVIGAVAASSLRGLANDVYFQVCLLTTMGLASKNAILIVEFAKEMVDQGSDVVDATLRAIRMRLRPILMTSMAFGFGVLPLAISSGAGSASQHAVGTGVFGGVLGSTVLGIFFIPLFFVVVKRGLFKRNSAETTSNTTKD